MKPRLLALALIAAIAAPAAAQAPSRFQDDTGRAWDAIRSETGVVLATRGITVQLRRDCRAVSARYGDGSWTRTGNGFTVQFSAQRIAFSGQLALEGAACQG